MTGAAILCAIALQSCRRQPQSESNAAAVVETQWTKQVAERAEALSKAGKVTFSLPQLRVYDAKGALVYVLDQKSAWKPATIGAEIDRAVSSGQSVAGPSLDETLADLQAADGRPASNLVAARGTPVVFDYWASWCVPCKILEKALLEWQAKKPADAVQIVKAEADPTKLDRARGEKVYMVKKGPDGKLVKVEMK